MTRATHPTDGRLTGQTREPLAVGAAGLLGAVLAAASVLLPYAVHLTRPDIVTLGAGLVVLGCGLVMVRGGAPGPAPWLVYASGATWFLPALAVSGRSGLDIALRCTALVHVALMAHAVLAVGSVRLRGAPEHGVVSLGYATALTAVVGGFRIALPVTGLSLAAVAVTTGSGLPTPVRRLRALAGLVLGGGLVLDAVVRLSSSTAERWIAVSHPLQFAAAAVLVTAAGSRRRSFDVIASTNDSGRWLATVLEHEMGVRALDIAVADGPGRWLTPDGEPRTAPAPGGLLVHDESGALAGVLETNPESPLDPAVVQVFALSAANARLRRSVTRQIEELEASRRRLLTAADSERAALASQLRARVIARVSGVERDLGRHEGLASARERATTTRRALQMIAVGIDPLAPDGALRPALVRLATEAPCSVTVTCCDEPESRETGLALWYCCAEAISNATKHAPGSTVSIDIRRTDDRVTAVLSDDGPGGADPGGRGLRGLADRVETLGGTLTVTGAEECGTSLLIELPDADLRPASDCGNPLPEARGDRDVLPTGATYGRGHLHQRGPS